MYVAGHVQRNAWYFLVLGSPEEEGEETGDPTG